MKKLSSDWFVEGMLDFEYKKYLLLAYLKHVAREFAEVRLYPTFSDLIHHYKNLTTFQKNKQQLFDQFPGKISEEDFKQLRLAFEPDIIDGPNMKEIEAIVEYAIPQIHLQLKEGKGIYEYIEEQLKIEPVGITPLYKREGYLLFRISDKKQVKVYEYQIVFFENTDGNYHGISFQHVDTLTHSLANTYEAMKLHLIRHYTKLPNPATWLLYAVKPFPEEASLLPIAKRKMLSVIKGG
ncbi:MAG: hypothetical protein AAF587_36765 [Bacteroidota bacterium]